MKRTAGLLGFLLLLATSTVNAAVSDEEFQEVKDLLQQALARIEQLEVGNARTNATVAELAESNLTTAVAVATLAESNEQTTMAVTNIETEKQSASWPERISWSGDFRYRYQNEDRDIDAEDRNQQRVRARPAMTAMVTESIDVGFGIATGGDDPVSANQTLGNGSETG